MKTSRLFTCSTLLGILLLCICISYSQANNINVSNGSLLERNSLSHYANIQFDLSWEHSWRSDYVSENYDAAWVFLKFRVQGEPHWHHATLSPKSIEHTAPRSANIEAVRDGKGVFIYRAEDGEGPVSFEKIKLRWEYGQDNVDDDAEIEIRIFAIEMVYIPEAVFFLGDPESFGSLIDQNTGQSVMITDEPVMVISKNNSYDDRILERRGVRIDGDDGIGDKDTVLNTGYPTGYKAFYSMKYEISQEQYADFLNTLSKEQAKRHYYNAQGQYAYGIDDNYPHHRSTLPFRACNYLSWTNAAAYADWAALRPMTELEFEKICRGPMEPQAGEMAWGKNTITKHSYRLKQKGMSNEQVNTDKENGNANYYLTYEAFGGPARCGVFATDSSTRQEAGAAYYGVMEMSGNLYEHCVTLGNSIGRAFTGLHGDGLLTEEGYADVENWPGLVRGKIQNGKGSGFRGGYWFLEPPYLQISNREFAAFSSFENSRSYGFRAVRTAPNP